MGLLVLLAASAPVAASDEPRAVIQGSWIATFGQFRGEWSGWWRSRAGQGNWWLSALGWTT